MSLLSSPSTDVPAAEAPLTLTEPASRSLGLFDQLGFWGNLGISLLGFGGAIAIQAPAGVPALSITAAFAAVVVGTIAGVAILGSTLAIGARTGAPAMVLMRGLFGGRASWLPTGLNIAQCLGWGAFELVVISSGLSALSHGAIPTWVGVVAAGILTTLLTIWPLGSIRVIRRYVTVLVVLAVVVLAVDLLARPMPAGAGDGSWLGFGVGVDVALAVAVSWVPLGADYTRHSRTPRAAFLGGFVGYGLTQIACYGIGLLALAQVAQDPERVFDLFLSLPLGVAVLGILVLREADQSFANVYSTAVSLQNLAPRADRRVLSVAIGMVVTVAALAVDINALSPFLYLIGAVFVPLSGVLLAAWWRGRGTSWNLAANAPTRPAMLFAWAAGFIAYQLVNPGAVAPWSDFWARLGEPLGLIGQPWSSASVLSFAVAFTLGALLAGTPTSRPRLAEAELS